MGFFDLLLGKSSGRVLEKDDAKNTSRRGGGLDIIGGLTGTDSHAKTEEQKDADVESGTLKSRLGQLKIKRYKDDRQPKYNDDSTKKRLEIGSDFDLKNLPELIYKIAQRSGDFRSDIGGRFDLQDKRMLRQIMRKRSYTISRMKQDLDDRNEHNQKTNLGKLFK